MGKMTKVMCTACGHDVLMTVVDYEELKISDRGRALRRFRCGDCDAVARRFEQTYECDGLPEWKRMSLLPEGAKVRGRRRPYGGMNEFRTFRPEEPGELPPDDWGNRVDYPGVGEGMAATGDSRGILGSAGWNGKGAGAAGSDADSEEDNIGNRMAEEPAPERWSCGGRGSAGGDHHRQGPGTGNGENGGPDRHRQTGRGQQRNHGGRPEVDENGQRKMYKTTCSRCFKPARVPFRPTPARTIYCRQCMIEKGMRNH